MPSVTLFHVKVVEYPVAQGIAPDAGKAPMATVPLQVLTDC